jgi:dTDP-3-amino-3,4,6-trideoxy-alpha-D-glucose transaminase
MSSQPRRDRIDFADPRAQLLQMREELSLAFEQVLESGSYILGDQVVAFEEELALSCAVPHAVGVSSGTDALTLALRAAGVGAGDEVLVPAMTAIATWMAVAALGAVPVGVDIERQRSGMDAAAAREAITTRTRAIVVVHLFGEPADVTALAALAREHDLIVLEDMAQAQGARLSGRPVGSFGVASALSFYPTKNLGAIGDAGAVISGDPALAERVAVLRQYGCYKRWDAAVLGMNARLDELQAAFLRVGLRHLDAALERRCLLARQYLDGLAGVPGLELPDSRPGGEPAWHLFVVRHPRRDALAEILDRDGIGTLVHYEPAPALAQVFRDQRHQPGMFPNAERHAACSLSLPLHPGLQQSDVERVIDSVRRAAAQIRPTRL